MLSISLPIKSASGAQKYYFEQQQENYYLSQNKSFSFWAGSGAEALGLKGEVKPEEFRNVLRGFTPDGTKELVQNADQPKRQHGWDLTFSAPKSVSALWAVSPKEIQKKIEAAHHRAVEKALAAVEETAITRRGKAGKIFEPAKIITSVFTDVLSRANEPQIHSHAVLPNVCVRHDGTTGTLRTKEIFEGKKAFGAVYQTELGFQLRKELGLTIESERVGFHIQGVPKNLCKAWSSRRAEIVEAMQKHGVEGAVDAKKAALVTRSKKENGFRQEFFDRWKEVAQAYDFGPEQAQKLVHPKTEEQKKTETQTTAFREKLKQAISQVPAEKKTRKHTLELARKLAIAHGVGGVDFKRAFDEEVTKKAGFVHVEWKQAFAKAPFWSPVRVVKVPRIVIGNPVQIRRWGNILFERDTALARVRVQQRILFPKAPKWSPFHGVALPALRVGKMRLRENELWDKVKWTKQTRFGEIRIQERRVFPRALKWNEARNVKLPVIRFVEGRRNITQTPQVNHQQHSH